MTGAIDRMGKPADGNTVCDYDAEETRRQISISTSVAPLEYKGCKINILDTPGSFDFSGEVLEALQVSDAAIIVCSAKDGISVGLEKPGATARSATCPALSIFPRQMRKTPTITPPSTPCVSASATRSPPSWSPSGTTTRRSPASSTCSTSAPTRCRTANGWRSSCRRAKRTWSPSSTTL